MTDTAVTIPHLALLGARRFGTAPAIVPPDAEPISFADLSEQAMAAARAFVAAGIQRGDTVAVWAPNSAEWIIATLGAQAAGAALVPLNTRYKGAEAAYILRASGARILLTVSGFLGNDYPAMIAAHDVPSLERVVRLNGGTAPDGWAGFIEEGARIDEAAVRERLASLDGETVSDILFTSGTTGRPKGVVTTHAQNLAVYRTYAASLGWTARDRLLAINPFFHSFGYKAGWVCSLMQGSTLYPVQTFEPAAALDAIERYGITLMPGPPTIFQALLALPLEERNLSSLRLAVTGATIVPAALVREMRDTLGFKTVLTAYGMTETCGVVSMCSEEDDIETIATTSGRAIEGVEVRIVDADGKTVASGTPGEVLVSGPNVMRGYLDDPSATAEAIAPGGWLRTGDIGVMRADGCISVTDRSKDLYICGGFNVSPAEVERLLAQHPEVIEAAVVGMPDARLGEVGHAFVVPRAGVAPPDGERALIAWARETMANYKAPRAVTFVEALPRNASGKVEKFRLKGMAE